jgi:phosphoglycerate dehydrogenase-like enzyme
VTAPGIAVGPISLPQLEEAIEAGGARVAEPSEAEGIVWIDPSNPQGLADLLEKSPAQWVQLPFAGIESFVEAGVVTSDRTWTCTKGAYGEATAEHALALILAGARRLHEHARATSWRKGWGQLGQPERRLKGMTVLIVGTGGIGAALARFLQPLGPRILAVNRSGRALAEAERTERTEGMHSLLPEADFVAIAAALTPETRGMFGEREFAAMKPEAWLVNVARGGLVDTDALVAALKDGQIGGAALDVTDPEPLPEDHPLWGLENTIITPHIANTADMAIPELQAMVRRNVEHFVKGENLEGLVDVSLGY